MKHAEKKDIANSTDIYPVIIANPIFRNLHNELLYTISKHIETIKDERNLLILGISPIASPYGDNKETFFSLFHNKGKIIAIDYNLRVISKCFQYLHQKGFFGRGNFKPKIIVSSKQKSIKLLNANLKDYLKRNLITPGDLIEINKNILDINSLETNSFIFIEKDLREKLNIPNNSASCIDATITLHHVAAYRQKIKQALEEIYRILKPRGLLHYGDGFVNMRRSEEKINSLMNLLTYISKNNLLLVDKRDIDKVQQAFYEYGKIYKYAPLIENPKKREVKIIEITNKGGIIIPYLTKDIISKLRNNGYKHIIEKKHSIELPLIDPDIKEDQSMIKEVNEYYDLNKKLKLNLEGFSQSQMHLAVQKGDEERLNALRGLVEYYCPVDFIISIIKEIGFANIRLELPNKKFVKKPVIGAIIAYKP